MPARPADQKVKILYIEDNRENRMLVRAVLEAAGYLIVDAEDGLAGIEAAIREEPALILLDINLPGVDGYEIVAILKSFPNLASTPVIAVTAYAMQGDRQRTLVAACDGYIQKPINVDVFPRPVAEFPGGKRARVDGGRAGGGRAPPPGGSGRGPRGGGGPPAGGGQVRRGSRPPRSSRTRPLSRWKPPASTRGSCAGRRSRRAWSRPAACWPVPSRSPG